MQRVRISEIAAPDIANINKMCIMPGSEPEAVLGILRESREAHTQAAAMGAKVFGAFLEGGEPVGRIEIMPVEAAPVPLDGDGLWVIRCLWVLDKARGRGIARSLMQLALDTAQDSKGVAVLTYPNWMPPAFFERFAFQVVEQKTTGAIVLFRKTRPYTGTEVCLVAPTTHFGQLRDSRKPKDFQQLRGFGHLEDCALSNDIVLVEAVFNFRCPWVIQQYRNNLSIASSISDKVVTREYPIRTHADALRLGEENLYIDGVTPFSGPVRSRELEEAIRNRLEAKGLL
jgi:GNAT superfamily N-acetyltransferase